MFKVNGFPLAYVSVPVGFRPLRAEIERTNIVARARKDAKLCFRAAEGGRKIYDDEKFNPEEVRKSALLLAGIKCFEDKRNETFIPLPKWRRNAKRPSCLDLVNLLRKEIAERAGAGPPGIDLRSAA